MLYLSTPPGPVKSRNPFPTPLTFVASLFAVLLLAGVFVVDLVSSREQYLNNGVQQVDYHGHMLAEHVARSFDSVEILLDELVPQISQLNPWWQWSPHQGHEFLKSRLTRSLPPIRHLIIFGADGDQRFTSFAEAPPLINIRDRPYFVQLRDGAAKARYGPYLGRNSNRPTYAVAHRLDAPDGSFTGALMVAIEPDYFEEFCWSTRPFEEFESALVNAEGRVVGLCRPSLRRGSLKGIGEDFRSVLAGGAFAGLTADVRTSVSDGEDFILAVETVPDYPDLRVISAIPKARLLAQWRKYALQSSLLGVIALLALAIAGLLIRRQFKEISGFAAQLRAHRDTLEMRVSEATGELEQRRRDAEQLAEAKSRFLAAASHDLRQPLQALRLFVGDLRRQLGDGQQKGVLQRIAQAIEAMNEQLDSLLEISRLDMADIEPQWATLPVEQVFDKLAATYRPLADAFGVRLQFSPRRRVIHGDAVLLARLLGNLIHNAIKFSPHGTVLVCARWGAGGATRIEVRDNGAGIDEKYQKAIFEEFFQLNNRAREAHAGLGLGLSIVSRIARLLDAPLGLRSRSSAGSTFSLRVKPAPTENVAPIAPAPAPAPQLLLIGRPGSRLRAFAKRAGEWGYAVSVAENAAAAQPLLAVGHAIPIAFPDPRRSDPAELARLLKVHPGIVIHPEGEDVANAGPYHLCLPLKPARVRALLRSLYAGRTQRRTPRRP